MSKNYLSMAALALCTLGITGCQDYEPFTMEEVRKGGFEKNFLAEYGQYMTPGMSWDLSNAPRTSKYDENALFGLPSLTRTVGASTEINYGSANYSDYVVKYVAKDENDKNYYEVPQADVLAWLKTHLEEKVNNTGQAQPFYMKMPNNATGSFTIVPIYQGNAVMQWDFRLVTNDDVDIQLWSRNEGILVERKNKRETNRYDWKHEKEWEVIPAGQDGAGTSWVPVEDNKHGYEGHTMDAENVKSLPIHVDVSNLAGKEFYFYLDITQGHVKSKHEGAPSEHADDANIDGWWGDYAYTGTTQKSTQGMMVALPCPLPVDLASLGSPTPYTNPAAMIIGCEDADLGDGDWDVNDVVFLLVSEVENMPEFYRAINAKRYMIEDLGNTYDFDFNDVVVDCREIVKYNVTHNGGTSVLEEDRNYGRKQFATLKHLCGTNPIQVAFAGGDVAFNRITDPVDKERTMSELKTGKGTATPGIKNVQEGNGWDPDHEINLNGKWNAETNNIMVFAWNTRLSEEEVADNMGNEVFTIRFPEAKTGVKIAPMMIAVPLTTNWMDEHIHIPTSWWQDGAFNNGWDQDWENVVFKPENNLFDNPNAKFSIKGWDGKLPKTYWQINKDYKWGETEISGTTTGNAGGNDDHFTIGIYVPTPNLKKGKYDFLVNYNCNQPIQTIGIKVGAGQHIASESHQEITSDWGVGSEPIVKTFGNKVEGDNFISSTIEFANAPTQEGITFYVFVRSTKDAFTFTLKDISFQVHTGEAAKPGAGATGDDETQTTPGTKDGPAFEGEEVLAKRR